VGAWHTLAKEEEQNFTRLMKVIIIGCGEVGQNIAQHLVMEGHRVVMVAEDAVALAHAAELMDVQTVVGLGSHPSTLSAAGADGADMLIAVTGQDEVNMVACQMAYSLFQIPQKIARVRDASYLSLTGSHLYTPDNLPVDVIISPELEVARAIERTVFVPGAFDVFPFAEGRLLLVGCKVGGRAPLLQREFESWDELDVPFQALALFRKERLIIPRGQDHLEPDDELYFVVPLAEVEAGMALLGKQEPPVRHAFVIGGGNVGYNLCRELERHHVHLRVVERQAKRCQFLAEALSRATILQADALNREALVQENIGQMDTVLCVTSDDATNILASIIARQEGVDSVLTLVHQSGFVPLAESVGLEKIVSPRQISVSQILQHVRRAHVAGVHTLRDGVSEVLELEIPTSSPLVGRQIEDIPIPAGAVIAAVVRNDSTVQLAKDIKTPLHAGNHAVVFAENEAIGQVEQLFGSR
jgi:trk system potassium uptake protein TrkA